MGLAPSALLGSTNKFFMPWLIPRNDRNSVYQANLFGKLAGRTKRNNEINAGGYSGNNCVKGFV